MWEGLLETIELCRLNENKYAEQFFTSESVK